jgi:hypothetical protein
VVDASNIVWGNLEEVDNLAWGTAADSNTLVWGLSADEEDNIVWGATPRIVLPSQPAAGLARQSSTF